MNSIKTYFMIINCLIISKVASQETKKYNNNEKQVFIKSTILNENRQLLISLPKNYERNIHDCPVIFVMYAESISFTFSKDGKQVTLEQGGSKGLPRNKVELNN